jgi:hypothetical protein
LLDKIDFPWSCLQSELSNSQAAAAAIEKPGMVQNGTVTAKKPAEKTGKKNHIFAEKIKKKKLRRHSIHHNLRLNS